MSLISSNVPNLVGGVSQQPAAVRRENQVEEAINAYGTFVEGLGPRRPTYHIAELLGTTSSPDDFWHFIKRDETEQYIVRIAGGAIKVWDLFTGTEKTVNTPNGTAYLTATAPHTAFRAISVADYTFIVNSDVVVEKAAALTAASPYRALINVKQGNYGRNYAIYVNGGLAASYSTPNGGVATDAPYIATDYIAGQLASQLAASLPGWPLGQEGSVIYFKHPSDADFALATSDGFSNLAMIPIKDQIARFTDLPTVAPSGFKIKITGDKGINGDAYYLQMDRPDGSRAGTWKECAAPAAQYQLDHETMPWTLVREADGTFTFDMGDWGERESGDNISNPWPSFVGSYISDVVFTRNRLGLIAGENVCFSRSGQYFEVFRRTVTALLDDDPVDVSSTSDRVSEISWAVPFNKSLVLFANQGQHELGADGPLTPTSATIVPTSNYEASKSARPAVTGTSVFFAVEQDGYAQIREYFNDGTTAALRAAAYNTTEHCPRYIPAGVAHIAASASVDSVAVLTEGALESIYVYSYLGDPTDRAQSAWVKWEMGGEVRAISFVKANLWIVIERDGKVWLETIPMTAGKRDTGVDFLLYLDRRIQSDDLAAPTYDAALNRTTFTLPYDAGTSCLALVRYDAAYAGSWRPGQHAEVVSRSGTTIVLKGDHRTTPLVFGFTFEMRVVLTAIYPKANSQAGARAGKATVVEGRLQLRYVAFLVGSTAYFKTLVKPVGRPETSKTFNGRVVGQGTTVIGEVPLYSGKVRVPVLGRSDTTRITIVHDSALPLNILAMEWEGLMSIRSHRT